MQWDLHFVKCPCGFLNKAYCLLDNMHCLCMIDCGWRFFSASSAQCIFLRFSIHNQILLDWYLFPWNPPNYENPTTHYSDVIMGAIASQITGVSIVNSIVCSVVDQRKYQSSASLAVVRVIHWWPVNSTKARKCFHLMTSSWNECSWNMASGWLAAQYYFGVYVCRAWLCTFKQYLLSYHKTFIVWKS